MVTRHVCGQIIDLCCNLHMMGIPVDGPTGAFGDNASSIIPQSTLNKRHNTLSYHHVRESIAAKILFLVHALTKALGLKQFWPLVQLVIYHWKGEVINEKPCPLIIKENRENLYSKLWGLTEKFHL